MSDVCQEGEEGVMSQGQQRDEKTLLLKGTMSVFCFVAWIMYQYNEP